MWTSLKERLSTIVRIEDGPGIAFFCDANMCVVAFAAFCAFACADWLCCLSGSGSNWPLIFAANVLGAASGVGELIAVGSNLKMAAAVWAATACLVAALLGVFYPLIVGMLFAAIALYVCAIVRCVYEAHR